MTELTPAEVFPPGEYLRDELEARGWTQTEFAEIIGRPVRLVNEIIATKRAVTPETAREFAAAFGTSAQYWMNHETFYQLSKAAPASESISKAAYLRERFPIREMIKRGWIEKSDTYEVLEQRVLGFYGLKSVNDSIQFSHAARRNHEEEISSIQLAWLFRVRQLATALRNVPKYSEKLLANALSDLEALMSEPEEVRHVPRVLHDAGVRFVIVEPPPSSKIEGVCFWIDQNKSPVIGLSLRFDRIDNFWFNLRHEIDHILHGEGKSAPVMDDSDTLAGNGEVPKEEQRANENAAEFCVPQKRLNDFIARHDPKFSTRSFIGFSRLVERHPGIVAGQLQRKTGRWALFTKFQASIRRLVTEATLTDGYGQAVPDLA